MIDQLNEGTADRHTPMVGGKYRPVSKAEIKANAEKIIVLSRASEVSDHLKNIGGMIAMQMLHRYGYYACTIGGVKTFFEINKGFPAHAGSVSPSQGAKTMPRGTDSPDVSPASGRG